MSAIKFPTKVLHLIMPRHLRNGGMDLSGEDAVGRHRRRVENLIRICWAVILVKSLAVVWAVDYYRLPFNPLWVIGPTVIFASLATAVYLCWDD